MTHFSGFPQLSDTNPAINDIPALMSAPSIRRQTFNIPKAEDILQLNGDEQIIKYIHKKFRSPVSSPGSDSSISRPMIKKVNISSPAPAPSSAPCSVIQQRRSVIVRRGDTPTTPAITPETTTIEIEFENIKSEDEEFDEYGENNVVKLSLNVVELENLFTHEERKYFSHSLNQFVGSWKAIDFGEQFMNMYVSFCQNKGMLPIKFISFISCALR